MDTARREERKHDMQPPRKIGFWWDLESADEVGGGLGDAEAEHLVPALAPEGGEAGSGDRGEGVGGPVGRVGGGVGEGEEAEEGEEEGRELELGLEC